MKNFIRLSVAALVLTGAVATTHFSGSTQTQLVGKVSAPPIPSCEPDGTTDCGIGN